MRRLEALKAATLDLVDVASIGMRGKPVRAALSALGIAIGIASLVAVLSLSASSKADLLAEIDRLGTNLLEVGPGLSVLGEPSQLPPSSPAMIRAIAPVHAAAAVEQLNATIRRTKEIPEAESSAIAVEATELTLLDAVQGTVDEGSWLTAATARYPVVILGAVAASRLGFDHVSPGLLVWLGNRWFTVGGILDPLPLEPELDRAALIGAPIAARLFGGGSPTTIYVRANPDRVVEVSNVLGPTANPEHPEQVEISRPSDALVARAAAKAAFTSLFLGLGGVGLLVGGIGIANVMVISVLERRSEIGLRRALGARHRDLRAQFLGESLLLAAAGGLGGISLGALAAALYSVSRGWPVVISASVLAESFAIALAVGAAAGVYPAIRAARLSPTEALRSV